MEIFGHKEKDAEIALLRAMLEQERQQNHLLRIELSLHQQELLVLRDIDRKLGPVPPTTHLSFIRIAIGGIMPVGPATLAIGAKATATVLGFDQNGAPFVIDFTANPVTWADDNEAAVSDAPAGASDPLTGVAAGVANITATCAGFTDTETVTVPAAVPVLSSIKISID